MADYIIPEKELRGRASADGITHLSTGVAVVRYSKVLAVRRAPDDFPGGMFELPGGGVEPDETFMQAVERELLEETGLKLRSILGMFLGFDYTTPKKPKVRQFNFLVEADGDVTLSPEHDQFVWTAIEDIPTLPTTGPMADCLRNALKAAGVAT